MTFAQGDMRTLPLSDASLAGIVAFYSLIHLERGAAVGVLTELTRVLMPGGLLLLAFHGGEGKAHADNRFGRGASIDAPPFQPTGKASYPKPAGAAVPRRSHRAAFPV